MKFIDCFSDPFAYFHISNLCIFQIHISRNRTFLVQYWKPFYISRNKNPKEFHTFSQRKTFLIFQETETLEKIFMFFWKKAFLTFQEMETLKKFFIFQEMETLKNLYFRQQLSMLEKKKKDLKHSFLYLGKWNF